MADSAYVRHQNTSNEDTDLEGKLSRLIAGKPLRVVDLFAGCGGMSLGLQRAGYTLLGGVEINPKATNTHTRNFFRYCDEEAFARHNTPRDIRTFSPEMFMREILQAEHPENLIDVIVGGPPCQAFSRIGRAKLRQVKQNPQAFLSDQRANLYIPYLQYVDFFRPLVVIMENVPDIMNYGGKNVAQAIADTLEEIGYRCKYTILNTAYYGIPQLRQRFCLIALLDALHIDPYFPDPSHFIALPRGYELAHNAALSAIGSSLFNQNTNSFVPSHIPGKTLPPAVTAYEALADLPPILAHLRGEMKAGTKNFDTLVRYASRIQPSAYVQEMRIWPSFESYEGVWDHVIRILPRDYPIFAQMKQGDEYPAAHTIALALFQKALQDYEAQTGTMMVEGSEAYRSFQKKIVPPYDPKKFPNKWWKLQSDQPSRTLTAHMGKDTYSHIHYDADQARVISVREAARLQSFPDGFQFTGPMNDAFAQIGNAVPPLLAYVLGTHVKKLLQVAIEQNRSFLVFT